MTTLESLEALVHNLADRVKYLEQRFNAYQGEAKDPKAAILRPVDKALKERIPGVRDDIYGYIGPKPLEDPPA